MNRHQRKYAPKNERAYDQAKKCEILEVLSPRNRRNEVKADKLMTNRSTSPSKRDQSQVTETNISNLEFNKDPTIIDTVKQLKELGQNLFCGVAKTEKSSQYLAPQRSQSYLKDKSRCENDNEDSLIQRDKGKTKRELKENIHITNTPRVKVIAKKFLKLKKNNLEVRKLDEKIVCVEYDVFDNGNKIGKPVQEMRVYFSIKPDMSEENIVKILPSVIQQQYSIADESQEFDKEIEILDGTAGENKPYINDLKVLKQKCTNTRKKNENSFLLTLYEMAGENKILDENSSNILSEVELEEFKNLILNKASSSVYGLSRRTIKREKETMKCERDKHMSESLFAELTRND